MYVQPNIYYTDNSEYIDLTTYNFIQHSTSLEANRGLSNLKKFSSLHASSRSIICLQQTLLYYNALQIFATYHSMINVNIMFQITSNAHRSSHLNASDISRAPHSP